MYVQHVGAGLPIYVGRRYQRGGGILASIARFALPMAKKMLTETVKAAPGVVDAILTNKKNAGTAILGGLKQAGMNTAKDTFNQFHGPNRVSQQQQRRGVRKRPFQSRVVRKTNIKKKRLQKDIFQ